MKPAALAPALCQGLESPEAFLKQSCPLWTSLGETAGSGSLPGSEVYGQDCSHNCGAILPRPPYLASWAARGQSTCFSQRVLFSTGKMPICLLWVTLAKATVGKEWTERQLDSVTWFWQRKAGEVESQWPAPESFREFRFDLAWNNLLLDQLYHRCQKAQEWPKALPTGSPLAPEASWMWDQEEVSSGSSSGSLRLFQMRLEGLLWKNNAELPGVDGAVWCSASSSLPLTLSQSQ